jgi:hypothetical protein
VRSEEAGGESAEPSAGASSSEARGSVSSEAQHEYQGALSRLDEVEKFSDEWFDLQERVIDLRNRKEDARTAGDNEEEAEDDENDISYLSNTSLVAQSGQDPFSRPYHERSSSNSALPSSLFSPKRSMSPPLLRCSPPSSPLLSRNLFSGPSINISYYHHDDEEEMEQLTSLRNEYSHRLLELEKLPKFSNEWFDLKTKIVGMEEQLETMESALDVERSICTHLSYGFDRSSAAWSEEDDEIVSFASDLELVMIGEALKAGNCIDAEDYEFLEELLPLEMCDFPETEEERERKAAIVVQREWRRYWRVKSWRCVKESVVKLQAFVRCKLQLTKYQRQRRQLIVLQSFLRKRRDTSKYQMALYSAYLIQSAWRRASVERSTLAVTSIQPSVRRWLA